MPINNYEFYTKAYKKYGVSAKGVNWNSEKSQKLRFEVITDILGKEIFTDTVVDAGCGFGELYAYWKDRGIHPKNYIGLDCMQDSVDIAKDRFPTLNFICRDILRDDLPLADWYIASGTLNILSSFDTWLFLEKILNSSKKGIVFNILEGYMESKNFNYQTKEDMRNFAKQKRLEYFIVDGYMKNDMTVRILR